MTAWKISTIKLSRLSIYFLKENIMYSFKEIEGNEHIIKSMRRAVKNKMVSHAYIISGAEGSGKKLIASAFAKTLLCDERADVPNL